MPTEAQLLDMGLSPNDPNDEMPKSASNWPRKLELHGAITASDQHDKPASDEL